MKPLPILTLLLLAATATLPAEEATSKPNPAFDKYAKGNVIVAGNIIAAGNPDGIPTRTLRATVTASKTVSGPISVECFFVLRNGTAYTAGHSIGTAGKQELPTGEGNLEFTFKSGAGQKILGWILRAYRGKEIVGAAAFPGKYEAAAAAEDLNQAVQRVP